MAFECAKFTVPQDLLSSQQDMPANRMAEAFPREFFFSVAVLAAECLPYEMV